MFKLESYITPIILSYVEKYVKNIRAEHSQVSLWGGDVSFSNLDLRLDVLQQELHLPFAFVSGHIHELQIHVPWTRLHAEPIVITINTIECVLKLPGDDDPGDSAESSSMGSATGSVSKTGRRVKPKKPDTPEAPPSYVQYLINKIISNVSIVCNNLILKYVEEDIVLSLNTRNLRLSSANELWETAFTELSLPDLILRKLLEVTDLTICLDKRNASGKIDTYQEPLLYRCSFMVHAAWVYAAINSKVPIVSRYEFKCPKLDFSLTDTQIPMFMRILRLLLALYYGEIAQRNRKQIEMEHGEEFVDSAGHVHTVTGHHPVEDGLVPGESSWTGWAWNMGTSVGSALLPIYWDEDESDLDVPLLDAKRDKVLHLGLFVDQASLVFKLTEHQMEKSPFGSAKQVFTPFARFDCVGIFQEVVVKGMGMVNVSLGISETLFSPIAECLCGRIDTKGTNEPEIPFFKSGESGHRRHLRGSLFEKDFGNESGSLPKERQRSYITDWDSHLVEWSEDKMLERTPSMAMDYLYYMDIPDDMTSEQLSEVAFDLENSSMSERALCRLVIGPFKMNVCSGLLHRVEIIRQLCLNYDYPPYVLPDKSDLDPSLSQPSKDEVDQLIQGTPFRVYQVTAINPSVNVYDADHPPLVRTQPRFRKAGLGIRMSSFERLPSLTFKLDSLDIQLSKPMYPDRLIRIVVPISDQFSSTLLKSCYMNLVAKVTGLNAVLALGEQSSTFFQGSTIQVNWKSLIKPRVWQDPLRLTVECHVDISSLKARCTRPQTLAIFGILQSHTEKKPTQGANRLLCTTLMEDALTRRMSSLVVNVSGIHGQYCETKHVRYCHGSVENLLVYLSQLGQTEVQRQIPILSRASPPNSHLVPGMAGLHRSPVKMSPGRAHTRGLSGFDHDVGVEPLLSFHVQVPLDVETGDGSVCPSLILGNVSQVDVGLDPKIMDWMVYVPIWKSGLPPSKAFPEPSRLSPKPSDPNLSRTFSEGGPFGRKTSKEGTSDYKRISEANPKRIVRPHGGRLTGLSEAISKWFPTLNSLLIQIRIEGPHLFAPRKTASDHLAKTVSEAMTKALHADSPFPLLCVVLPSVSLENVTHKPMIQQFLNALPIVIPESVWNVKRDNLPWTLKLSEFSIYTQGLSNNDQDAKEFILDPVSTSCTLGLTLKQIADTDLNNVAFAIHTDMSPIQANINEPQLVFLVDLCDDVLNSLAKMYPSLLLPSVPSQSIQPGLSLDEPTPLGSPNGSSTTGASMPRPPMDCYSESNSTIQLVQDSVKAAKDEVLGPFSLWIQWTVPSVTVNVTTMDQGRPLERLQLEMEDCQSSFDWTKIYFKMKGRVQAVAIRQLVKPDSNGWRSGDNHGIVLSCSDDLTHDLHFINTKNNNVEQLPHSRHFGSDTTFFSFTFTQAECSNIKKKWKDLMRKRNMPTLPVEDADHSERFVSEVDIKIAPFDIVLSPVVVLPFIKLFSQVLKLKILQIPYMSPAGGGEPQREPKSNRGIIGLSVNNHTLPMAYVQTKTIRVFLLSDPDTIEVKHQPALQPDFVLLTLDSINLAPQVDNPLSRILVRPDLYHMATPVLSLPGSHIEDRQYIAQFGGLGVFSGDWTDLIEKSEKPFKPVLKTMGENPALEWNTTKELTDQIDLKEVLVLPCLSKFDLQVTLAPAIVLKTQKNGREHLKLIAGHSLEINATTDIALHLSMAQMELLSTLTLETVRTVLLINAKFSLKSMGKIDSGIDCEASSQSRLQPESTSEAQTAPAKEIRALKFVPCEILITGSKISVSLFRLAVEERGATAKNRQMWRKYRYRQRRMEILEERTNFTEESDICSEGYEAKMSEDTPNGPGQIETRRSMTHDYDASEEESLAEVSKQVIKIYPLVHVGLFQPHIFATCSGHQQKLDMSFYDANVNLAPVDYFITCGGRRLPQIRDFPMFWFQTKQGDLDKKSGVPPALFTVSVSNFISLPLSVQLRVERPLKFDLGLDLLNQVKDIGELCVQSFQLQELLELVSRPVGGSDKAKPASSKAAKLLQTRTRLSCLASLSLSTQQVVLHFPVSEKGALISTEVVLGLMGIGLAVTLKSKLVKGQQVVDNVELKFGLEQFMARFCLCGITHPFLGPVTGHLKVVSFWLPQDPYPNIAIQLETDMVLIRLGPNHILAWEVIQNYVQELPGIQVTPEPSLIPSTALPMFSEIVEPVRMAQTYVDDLRAGAFQYVTNESSDNPKAYQVVFQKKPISAMTWRYPQPRNLTKVSVFPVPFMSASESGKPIDQNDEILCALQYWDVCLGSFLTYSTFSLSEQDASHLNLPTTKDRQRCAVSDMWRVVLYYDTSDVQGYDKLDREIIVTPKSLVSVIRVDSYFDPKMIPRIQGSIQIPSVVVTLSNHLHFHGSKLAQEYGPYVLKESPHPLDQAVASLRWESTLATMDLWNRGHDDTQLRINGRVKTTPSVMVTDLGFLSTHYVLLPTKIQAQANWTRGEEKEDCLDLGLNSKPLTLKYGHFVHHTLNKTLITWKSILERKGDALLDPTLLKEESFTPLTKYLVCNDTQVPVRFGQTNTEENHLLLPQNAFMYAWRSPKASLKLRVCVEGGLWQWCEAFELDRIHTFVTNIDNGERTTSLVISIKKVSPSERQIVIQGLLSAASLLKDHLEVRILPRPDLEQQTANVKVEQRAILGSFSSAPSFLINPEEVQGVKIRLLGIGTPWSGEIPLQISKGRNSSVLVRIPTKEKGASLTVWCRLVDEFHGGMRRSLMLFSPMYMARSLLPNPMKILISTPGQTSHPPTEMVILGRDVPVQLETSKPSDQKYNLAFKVVETLPASNPVPISWGMIEQVRPNQADMPKLDIDEIVRNVPKLGTQYLDTSWPFIDDEDMKLPVLDWSVNDQPKTDVQINFSAFHPLCNTLCAEINPWCLIVNQLGLPVLIKAGSGSIYEIANDSVLVPPFLDSTFHLGLRDLEGQEANFGAPLQLSDQEWRFRQLMPSVQGIVPKEGIIHTKIVLDHQVCFLTLRSRNENGIRVIHIKPTFCLTNKMKHTTLQCSTLTLMKSKKKMSADHLDLVSLDLAGDDKTYFPLLLWQIVGDPTKDQVFDGYQFISFSVPNFHWSLPLNLEDSRSIDEDRKRTVLLSKRDHQDLAESGNMPILVTVHQRLGQIFILVSEEINPSIIIHNNLPLEVKYGQSAKITGRSFGEDKFYSRSHQVVKAGQWCYYAFPWLDQNFPFKDGLSDPPSLVLTLPDPNGNRSDEEDWDMVDNGHKWTRDIDAHHQHEEFLLLPGHGDIKVVVETVGDISHVYIDPVSKIEISAKDIRSRIPISDSSQNLEASFVADDSLHERSNAFESPQAMESRPPTRYQSLNEAQEESGTEEPLGRRITSVTVQILVQELSLALTDDCYESTHNTDEFLRMTLDSLLISFRPKTNFTKVLRCQEQALAQGRELLLLIGNVQLDNQMFYRFPYDFPVIMRGHDLRAGEAARSVVTSTLQTQQVIERLQAESLVQVNVLLESTGQRFVARTVRVKSKPLAVNIEDKLVYKILDILGSFSLPASAAPDLSDRRDHFHLPQTIRLASANIGQVLTLDEFLVEPLDVSVSVHASIKVFIGLEQSPLNFSNFHKRGLRTTNYCLGQMLARHYISGALFRAGWVVGSLDMIGCPSGLTRSVGDGIRDFVALPYQGILQGPWAFVGGMAYGSTSLVKHVSAGTLTSMTSFASSMSRNLDRLSLDQEHCSRNELFRRDKPQGLGQGLVNGLSGVGISLLGAIGGLAHHPIHALMEQGASPAGLVSGLTRGLVGVVTKPLGGAAEFVAQTGQGLLHGTGWSKNLKSRYRSMPDHVCTFNAGALKYAWKMVGPAHSRDTEVLFLADVLQGKGSSAVVLILTPKVLLIVLADEDAQDCVHNLAHLDLVLCPEDPTKFSIHVQEEPHSRDDSVQERITQFVRDTSEFHCLVSDLESNEDGIPETSAKPKVTPIEPPTTSSDLVFYSSPPVRATFHAMFQMAQRQAEQRGFDML